MKLRDVTRVSMAAALSAVKQYAECKPGEEEDWDDVVYRVNQALAQYNLDVQRGKARARGEAAKGSSDFDPSLPENTERRERTGLGKVWMAFARGRERTLDDVAAATGYRSVDRRKRQLSTAACGSWGFKSRVVSTRPQVLAWQMLNPDGTFIEEDQYLPKSKD